MTSVPVSIVIVSRNRPAALIRCLTGVSQLLYDTFEIVVVADRPGRDAVQAHALGADVKLVAFDEANISVARNRGVAAAAGEIVAFIDDDAVPEPTWLGHLTAPFDEVEVAAVGGFVRARNGISWQWTAQSVDGTGSTAVLDLTHEATTVLTPAEGRAIKTEGTNMAIRRSVLADMGGFDPNFHYFHDETDLNLRLAQTEALTAIAPMAQVHHGYAENAVRSGARVPKDLFQIGASWAVFLNKHCPPDMQAEVWAGVCRSERKRALGHMVRGGLEPRDVNRLMRGLKAGYAEGLGRKAQPMPALPRAPEAFRAFPSEPNRAGHVLSGRSWSRRALRKAARQRVAQGQIVTLILLSPTALFHRVRFCEGGYWEQTGGVFGKSDRSDPLVRLSLFRNRVRRETSRVVIIRPTS
jgi:GT2 family glycosyltransferase